MLVLRKIDYFLVSLLISTGVFFLGGCSRSIVIQEPFFEVAVIARADLLSGEVLFGERAQTLTLPEDNVLEINDRMRDYLDRYVPRGNAESTRVRTLSRMIFGQGTLGMTYDSSKTHTARDAFRKLEGNCLAFSYLFTVLARARGLRVSFQEVAIPPEWSSGKGELYYLNRHVNVRIDIRNSGSFIIDIDQVNNKSYYPAWKISDEDAIALFYSNKGTDYLLKHDFENAFRYLVKALNLSPEDAAIWSNLGVLYRMQGIYDYAEKAYFIALTYKSRQSSVFSNLSVLYDHMGEMRKSEYYFSLARDYQMKNPYYRYHQALDAYAQGDYDLTLRHVKAALKRQIKEGKFHKLLGDVYAKLGDETQANKARKKAKELLYSQ